MRGAQKQRGRNTLTHRSFSLVARSKPITTQSTRREPVTKALDGLKMEGNFSLDEQWDEVVANLEILQVEFSDRIEEYGLSEAAVASLEPLFSRKMEEWKPLHDPESLVSTLRRLLPILGASNDQPVHRKATTFYESIIITFWLPKVRTVLVNDWNIHEARNAVNLLENWNQILPKFIYHQLLMQTIVGWLFEWLPLLSEQQRNPNNANGVMDEVKRKLWSTFDHWDVSRG